MLKNLQGANFFLMLSLGAVLIGFAPIFVKWSELSSSAILFWRMFLALPMLAILNYFLNKTFLEFTNASSTLNLLRFFFDASISSSFRFINMSVRYSSSPSNSPRQLIFNPISKLSGKKAKKETYVVEERP